MMPNYVYLISLARGGVVGYCLAYRHRSKTTEATRDRGL
jgi:hypothetical protein